MKKLIVSLEQTRQQPTLTTYPDGSKYWFLNGRYHREDGPAIEYADGSKWWYINHQQLELYKPITYKGKVFMLLYSGIWNVTDNIFGK